MATLTIKAATFNTGVVMDFVGDELEKHGLSVDLHPEILIGVEEVFVNIAYYAYEPSQDGYVDLSVTINENAVIQFEDSGQPFNPLEGDAPDLDTPIMEREIGGLGIHFVKNMMDKVEYVYADGKNILTITKDVSKNAMSKQSKVN